jgi:hypothetical protein
MSKGGKREGAGRPVSAPSAVLRIRLPLPVHAQVVELGGAVWLKRIISEALIKKN